MTEEVSHASSNPSPNTLSIVNIVCVFSHLCVYVHCVRQRKIQTTATLRQPTAPNVFIATGQFQTQLQTPTCLCFTLGDVAVSLTLLLPCTFSFSSVPSSCRIPLFQGSHLSQEHAIEEWLSFLFSCIFFCECPTLVGPPTDRPDPEII